MEKINYEERIKALAISMATSKCVSYAHAVEVLFLLDLESSDLELTREQYEKYFDVYKGSIADAADGAIEEIYSKIEKEEE